MKWILYRFVMRLAHRFNWHYAPPNQALTRNGWPLHWCQWCGMSDFVMPRMSPKAMAEELASFSDRIAPAVRSEAEPHP